MAVPSAKERRKASSCDKSVDGGAETKLKIGDEQLYSPHDMYVFSCGEGVDALREQFKSVRRPQGRSSVVNIEYPSLRLKTCDYSKLFGEVV